MNKKMLVILPEVPEEVPTIKETMGDPVIVWDESSIINAISDDLLKSDPSLSEDDALKIASEEGAVLSSEWEYICEELTDLMKELYSDSDMWSIDVHNFGWNNQNGHKEVCADSGEELLDQILPKTQCTFHIYDQIKAHRRIVIHNTHHNSPVMGNEVYYISPLEG